MNKILLFALLFFAIACNKKNKQIPEPIIPEESGTTEVDSVHFLKEVVVPGATKVVLDSLTRNILVTLPESYTNDAISINLKFYLGASLTNTDRLPSPDKIEFFFKNSRPFSFYVTNSSRVTHSFKIFVKHDGPLKATLDQTDVLRAINGIDYLIPIHLVSGIGTMPETPSSKDSLSVILADEKMGNAVNGHYFSSTLYFRNVESVISANRVFLKLSYGPKSITLGKDLRFPQINSMVYLVGNDLLFKPTPVNQKVSIEGRDFLPAKTYKVKIESDYQPSPVTVEAIFESSSTLYFTIPSDVPNGSYSLSIFENGGLVKRVPLVISSKEVKAIRQIWRTRMLYPWGAPSFMNTGNIIVTGGNPLFVNQFPALLGGMYKPLDVKTQLPQLQLKDATKQVVLNPKVRGDESYGDGAIVLYYGEYTIPADLPSGRYEVRMLYADKSESLPFWNKIEVQ